MQPYSKNIYFIYALSLPPFRNIDNTKNCREYHKYLLCPKTVKRYVSGHSLDWLHHAKKSRSLLLTTCEWQRGVQKKVSKYHPSFLHAMSWCSCHTGASEELVHCQGNSKHQDRNTKCDRFIIYNNLSGFLWAINTSGENVLCYVSLLKWRRWEC